MDYRRIAGTDLDLSVLCFVPMRSAAKDGSHDDVKTAGSRALECALDNGANFLHSSYQYKTRWMMTEVLKDHPKRHDIHHVIKLPVPDWDDGRFLPEKFRMRIEEALTEVSETIEEQRDEGKVGYLMTLPYTNKSARGTGYRQTFPA